MTSTTKIKLFPLLVIFVIFLAGPTSIRADNPIGTQPATNTPRVPVTFNLKGVALSGTAGTEIPAGLQVTLHVAHPTGDGKLPSETVKLDSVITADKTFRFDAVSALSGDIVFVTTQFEGVLQGSPLLQVAAGQPEMSISETLYSVTNDPGVISLLSVQNILDLIPEPTSILQVLATYDYKNTSDRLYLSTEKTETGQPISVKIPLPVGARGVAFNTQPTSRFSIGGDVNAPVIRDTKAVLPGLTHEIVFSYQLPYASGIPIDQDYPYNTVSLSILVPGDSSLKINDDQFTNAVNNTINPQRTYIQYTLRNPLHAGDRLKYALGGNPLPTKIPASQLANTGGSSTGILFLAVGAVILVSAITMLIFQRLRRR